MAPQICPKCKKDTFHWSTDDNFITSWWCNECKFYLIEDEYREHTCEKCNKKEKYLVRYEDSDNWYCWSCITIT